MSNLQTHNSPDVTIAFKNDHATVPHKYNYTNYTRKTTLLIVVCVAFTIFNQEVSYQTTCSLFHAAPVSHYNQLQGG